jgi:hypothetical protein
VAGPCPKKRKLSNLTVSAHDATSSKPAISSSPFEGNKSDRSKRTNLQLYQKQQELLMMRTQNQNMQARIYQLQEELKSKKNPSDL